MILLVVSSLAHAKICSEPQFVSVTFRALIHHKLETVLLMSSLFVSKQFSSEMTLLKEEWEMITVSEIFWHFTREIDSPFLTLVCQSEFFTSFISWETWRTELSLLCRVGEIGRSKTGNRVDTFFRISLAPGTIIRAASLSFHLMFAIFSMMRLEAGSSWISAYVCKNRTLWETSQTFEFIPRTRNLIEMQTWCSSPV